MEINKDTNIPRFQIWNRVVINGVSVESNVESLNYCYKVIKKIMETAPVKKGGNYIG